MRGKSSVRFVQVASVFSLAVTLIINCLSTTMPLNGRTAGQIANRFNNLLIPESMIFTIWALIYSLLLIYAVYVQMRLHRLPPAEQQPLVIQGWLFTASGFLNSIWIFAWHYFQLRLSMGIMLTLLVVLIMLYADIPVDLPLRERWLRRLPFSVYTAWVSFCCSVNAAAFLAGTGWRGGALGQKFWTLMILAGLVLLGWLALLRRHDLGFALTIAWGIAGILVHHLTVLRQAYPMIISGAIAALVLLAIGMIWLLVRQILAWPHQAASKT